jgi:hypothetical protein
MRWREVNEKIDEFLDKCLKGDKPNKPAGQLTVEVNTSAGSGSNEL